MTTEQRRICDLFAVFETEHNLDFDDVLEAFASDFEEHAEHEQDGQIATLQTAIAEYLREAAMAFYVSTK